MTRAAFVNVQKCLRPLFLISVFRQSRYLHYYLLSLIINYQLLLHDIRQSRYLHLWATTILYLNIYYIYYVQAHVYIDTRCTPYIHYMCMHTRCTHVYTLYTYYIYYLYYICTVYRVCACTHGVYTMFIDTINILHYYIHYMCMCACKNGAHMHTYSGVYTYVSTVYTYTYTHRVRSHV